MSSRPPEPESDGLELTSRERQLARMLGEDLKYSELARRMGIRTETVRLHAKNLYRKLGVSSRYAAVEELWRRGLRGGGRQDG